jgi:hypothetical protein
MEEPTLYSSPPREEKEEEKEEDKLLVVDIRSPQDDEKFVYVSPKCVRKYTLLVADLQRIVDYSTTDRVAQDIHLRDWIHTSVQEIRRRRKNEDFIFEGSTSFWENLASDWQKGFCREKLKNPTLKIGVESEYFLHFGAPLKDDKDRSTTSPQFIRPEPSKASLHEFPSLYDYARVYQYKFGLTLISDLGNEEIVIDARSRPYEHRDLHLSWYPPSSSDGRFLWTYEECMSEATNWIQWLKINPPSDDDLFKKARKCKISIWKRPVDLSSHELRVREQVMYIIARSAFIYGQSFDSVERCLADALTDLDNKVNLGFSCVDEIIML